MAFFVAADAYDRFMGRYSSLLAPQLADFAGVGSGQRVLEVGCGPGALTSELVRRLGASAVVGGRPVGAVRRRSARASSRGRRASGGCRRAAVRRRRVRRGARAARRPLHGRPRARAGRDGACDAGRRRRRARASGITPVTSRRCRRSGRRPASSSPEQTPRRISRAPEEVSSPSSSARPVCATSRRPPYRSTSSTRPSRTGGSRSRSVSARPASTSRRSTPPRQAAAPRGLQAETARAAVHAVGSCLDGARRARRTRSPSVSNVRFAGDHLPELRS